jgi:type IV pilus assembly protein PilO
MPRNFNLKLTGLRFQDPRVATRAVVGVLLLANVAAALIAFHPWGGSAEDLRRQQEALRAQIARTRVQFATARTIVSKVERARTQGDKFLKDYVTDRRVTYALIVEELNRTAKEAGIKEKERTYQLDPVEGSDTLSQMTISAGYEGTYANLTKFIHLLDRSPRFLIIESMVAAPQQSGQNLNVSLKLDTFVTEASGSAT